MEVLWTTTVLLGTLLSLLLFEIYRRYRKLDIMKDLGLRGPPISLFLGSMWEIIGAALKEGRHTIPMKILEYQKAYGSTRMFYLGIDNPQIQTTDKEIIREVFIKQFQNFADRELVTPLTECYPWTESLLQIGRHGAHNYGWKEIRSVVSPAFTSGKMKLMHPILHERATTLVQSIAAKLTQSSLIDIYDEFQALTLDVIGRTAFGVEADSLHDRNDPFYVECRDFFNNFNVKGSWALLIGFISKPLGRFVRYFSQIYWIQRRLSAQLKAVVLHRRANIDTFKRVDLINLLLQEDAERQKRENKPPMHIDTIVSNCFAFLLAGYETTSTALAYAAYLLAEHAEVQERLVAEIEDTFEVDESVEYERVMKMTYLDAVFKETLRLKPPVVFFTGRRCVQDAVVNGIRIQKGVNVSVPVHGVHWDENNWPEPLRFDPERFLGAKTYDQLSWMPFGVGPRYCVGMRFAEMEFKLALVEVLRRFRLDLHPSQGPLLAHISTALYRPMGGVHLKVTVR